MTRPAPEVSVVLPSKNRAELLRKALENCLTQTQHDLELIVVNDGSTDSTAEVCRRFASDPRVTVLECSRSQGLPRALNVGFAAARGRYVTWTSDDNAFHPNALERMATFLRDHAEVGLVYADNYAVLPSGEKKMRPMADPDYLVEMNVVGACFMYRREVMEAVGGYSSELVLAEDYDFFLRVFLAGFKMHHMREVLYDYLVHEQALGAVEGHDRVKLQAERVLKLRLSPWRREWIRLRRRLRVARAKLGALTGR